MKKIISTFFVLIFTATSAFSAGMVGIKLGYGELEATKNAITNTPAALTEAAETKDIDNEFGSIFAEINIGDSPVSLGLEYIPITGTLSVANGNDTDASLELSDHTTLYALVAKELSNGASVYGKIGYSMADIGNVKQSNGTTTINSHDDNLKGPMAGIGVQSAEFSNLALVARLEATYTEYDDVSVRTTDATDDLEETKTAKDINLTTFTISLGKKF
jgi:hypothetical protein